METLDEKRYMVEETAGYAPSIGRLLSMMHYVRITTLEAAQGLTSEELDYRIGGQGNSIGCLLYHMACVEEVYQIVTFEDRNPTETEFEKLGVGLELGEKAHQIICNRDLSFYIEQLSHARARTMELFTGKDDSWLDEVSPFGQDHEANNYFRWFHVFEDEINHRGQIRLIRRHMEKNR
ncbi:DinB family protein [Halobacillus sp. A1]|uniref:DinB family protein n=1 Tax=Halobacillus sp. A1 TaxID=2880262 RepID=UPI0035319D23